ncbi:hypothetical protein L6164_036846 [Bauhinia variegata]|uniref:Uncharacterized protein n=1 Tax=Bauhinia variegata TaxID=167791 RepID=A0ACB9KIG1_BAUVA|nr:hypothetical protein L6164_036846 [Bauhinia variegata]
MSNWRARTCNESCLYRDVEVEHAKGIELRWRPIRCGDWKGRGPCRLDNSTDLVVCDPSYWNLLVLVALCGNEGGAELHHCITQVLLEGLVLCNKLLCRGWTRRGKERSGEQGRSLFHIPAAEADSIDLLYTHIQADPFALERIDAIPFIHTPLHVAAAAGNTRFASEVIKLKPSFAWKLNGHGLSPLHLAIENSELSIVHRFVYIHKDLIRVKGKNDLTPLHSVSRDGRVELLAEFLAACPESIVDVTVQSETALHVALKHRQFGALKVLLCWLMSNCKKHASDVHNLVLNWKDEDGNTILHILVGQNGTSPQMVELMIQGEINLNAKNSAGLTALDIVNGQNQDDANIVRIKNVLLGAKARSARSIPAVPTLAETIVKEVMSKNFIMNKTKIRLRRFRESITDETRNILLVVAVLVATSTNQAALSPPGGVYQSDASNLNDNSSKAWEIKGPGKSVMSYFSFQVFWTYNTMALLASALAIYILLPPVGEFMTLLLIFPLLYFVFGFFFSMSVVGRHIGRILDGR